MKYRLYKLSSLLLTFLCLTATAQHHAFDHYGAKIYKGHEASIKIKGNALAEMYRTIITNTYYNKVSIKKWHGSTGLNFAGHYCFAWWGCGSPCQNSAVVDVKTGTVYAGITASLGYDFKLNSRMVIVNPALTKDRCAFCNEEYWLWNENLKKFVMLTRKT